MYLEVKISCPASFHIAVAHVQEALAQELKKLSIRESHQLLFTVIANSDCFVYDFFLMETKPWLAAICCIYEVSTVL